MAVSFDDLDNTQKRAVIKEEAECLVRFLAKLDDAAVIRQADHVARLTRQMLSKAEAA